MGANMRWNLKIITSRGLAIMFGWMDGSMRGLGEITRCMDGGYLYGLMVGNMRASISMIRRRDSVNLVGLMDDAIKDSGRMANKMGRAHIGIRKVWRRMGLGSMGRKLSGMIDLLFDFFYLGLRDEVLIRGIYGIVWRLLLDVFNIITRC
jgi:hypothetical protein